jgi:hypothetical protein
LILESAKLRLLETKPTTVLRLLESTAKGLSETTTILGRLEPTELLAESAHRWTKPSTKSTTKPTHRRTESARVSASAAAESATATHG